MSSLYENNRTNFEAILRKYKEYLALYEVMNHGSLAGAAAFDEFYWRMIYYSRYQDRRNFGAGL